LLSESKVVIMGYMCSPIGEGKKYVQILAEKPVGNQVAGRSRKWEDIRINLRGTSCQKGR
jgi:hypothetical protein